MIRTCPHCKNAMLLLFYTAVCEVCDNPPRGIFYRGYVVYRGDVPYKGDARPLDYVWKTPHDAAMWRNLQNMDAETYKVRVVLSHMPFSWRVASGLAAGLICNEKLAEIHKDHRYAPQPNHAFLFDNAPGYTDSVLL